MQISIDGPAGAGKSSVARALAHRLGYIYIDTGAMYRAVTWLALKNDISAVDEEGLTLLAQTADIRFEQSENDDDQQVYCRDHNVTQEIRSVKVSRAVSAISVVSGVRSALVKLQQEMAADHDVVMEGRDIGTVVLPSADLKVYLTASVEERADRRQKERAAGGQEQSLAEIVAEIMKRDADDSGRADSPLRPPDDSVILDTTDLSLPEVVAAVAMMVKDLGGGIHPEMS